MGTDEFLGKGMAGLYTVDRKRTASASPSSRATSPFAAFDSYLNAGTAGVNDEDAYAHGQGDFTTNWGQLQKDYPPLRGLTKANAIAPPNNPIPYHPGAVKYYKEARHLHGDANAKNACDAVM